MNQMKFLNLLRTLLITLGLTMIVSFVNGQTRFAISTGIWSGAIWAATASGVAGSAASPVSADDVTINSGITVTVDITANCKSLSFLSAATVASNVNINSGITLNVSGVITIPRQTNNINTLAVGAGTLNAGSIAFTGGGTFARHQMTISTGTVSVSGDITTDNTGTSATITFTAAGTLNVGGQLMSSGTVGGTLTTFGGCTINYNGLGAQTIKDAAYLGNLIISGSGTKTWTLAAARSVGGTLDVSSGTALSLAGGFSFTTTGAVTNNGTLTLNAATTLSSSTFNNNASAVLNIGGTSAITTLNASTAGNTVNYTGGVQTVLPVTYSNLTLSGSGTKTTTGVTINGVLSLEGTATVSTLPTYGGSATLQYNTTSNRSAGVEWVSPFVATGGVKITSSGTITLNGGKIFGANTNVPLTINNSATLSTSSSFYGLTFQGDFINNNGILTAGSSPITINGTTSTQNIGGFTTTGLVTMSKTSGTATFTGNVNGAGLTINGTGGTLDLGALKTHTFTGTWTRTAGTLNGGSSTINFSVTGVVVSGTGGTFNPNTGTVNYSRAGAQTVAALTYNNLTISGTGSNIKTFASGSTTVNGVFSREGTSTVTLTGTLNYGGSAILQYKGSAAQVTGAEFPNSFTAGKLAGINIENTLGVTLNAAKDIGARSFNIGTVVAGSIFNDGGFQLTATGTLNLTSGTFKLGLAAAATTFPAFGTRNIAAATTVEYAATATQAIKGITYSNLTISGTGANSKTADADITVNGVLNLVSANASATQGCLEMTKSYVGYPGTLNSAYLSSWKLYMGASSSTTGTGDVTGTVVRNYTLIANTPYSFGNQFTTVSLTPGTMPTALAVTITIGTVPPGKINSIKRTYEIVPTGGSGSTVTANFHYLDTELNLNTETSLVTWDYDMGGSGAGYSATPDEHGRASFDNTNNFIGLANIPVEYFIQVAVTHDWRTLFTLANFGVDYLTWNGSISSDWTVPGNWTLSSVGSGTPNSSSHVIIPDAASTSNDPVLPAGIT